MISTDIYEYLERISSLLRTDVRRAGSGLGLQPVQLEALHYLSRCNRYSNTPMGVTEFLGLTKGTVSQTIGILEAHGLIEKRPDPTDGRVVHLHMTDAGREMIAAFVPPRLLETAMAAVPEGERDDLADALRRILRHLQHGNGLKTFGACKSCRHHRLGESGGRHCGLTGEPLSDPDAEQICREHQPVESSSV